MIREPSPDLQAQVSMLDEVKGIEIIINEQYVGDRIAAVANSYWQNGYENVTLEQVRGFYLSSFISMAHKGFYSYDRVPDSNAYMFICGPKSPVNVAIDLPIADAQITFIEEDKSLFIVEHY